MDQPQPLPDARIFTELTQLVRKLATFDKKRHYVPDSITSGALEMVEKLTHVELDEKLDRVFKSLRSAYGLKRRQIDVHGPDDRNGVIETPFFNIEMNVELDEGRPDTVIWKNEINQIRDIEQIVGSEFDSCFDSGDWVLEVQFGNELDIEQMIDSIEDLNDGSVTVEYDKGLEWCEIQAGEQSASLRATGTVFQVHGRRAMTPKALIEALLQYQTILASPGMPSLSE